MYTIRNIVLFALALLYLHGAVVSALLSSLDHKTLVLDFAQAEQASVGAGSPDWRPAMEFGTINHLAIKFKTKKSVLLKPGLYIASPDGLKFKNTEPFRLRCKYRYEYPVIMLSVQDEMDDEDGYMSMDLCLFFRTDDQGEAQGYLQVGGERFQLKGIAFDVRDRN